MGLDSVEIVMKVEEAFGISIPDAEAEKMATVGAMYEVVWSRIHHKPTDRCITQKLFYRLRKHFRQQLKIPDDVIITPATKLNELIPRIGRQRKWRKLQNNFGFLLPKLQVPFWLQVVKAIFFCLVAYLSYRDSLGFGEIIGSENKLLLLLPVLPAILVNKAISAISKYGFPQPDMRGLSFAVLHLNFQLLSAEGITQKEVQQIINNILVDLAGVDPKDISPEKSFVYDLGIN